MNERNVRLRDVDPMRAVGLGLIVALLLAFWAFVLAGCTVPVRTHDGRIVPTTCEECITDSECEALCAEEE